MVDGDQSLLVDTLFDLKLTRTMLAGMRDAEPTATRAFDKLVNTHANAGHCNGNELVAEAEIIASKATADELAAESPAAMDISLADYDSCGRPADRMLSSVGEDAGAGSGTLCVALDGTGLPARPSETVGRAGRDCAGLAPGRRRWALWLLEPGDRGRPAPGSAAGSTTAGPNGCVWPHGRSACPHQRLCPAPRYV